MKYRGWLGAVLVGFSVQVSANEVGEALLMKMSDALHRLSYSGTLVHIKGEDVNTLSLRHEVIGGVEKEIITSLNGAKDAISKERQTFSLAKVHQSIESMKQVYSLDVGATKTVAQRECQIIIARPKDKMRYLQKYCIDKQSGLPLSYSLMNKKHKTVERFTFTQVDIQAGAGGVAQANDIDIQASAEQLGIAPVGNWQMKQLPKGFSFRQMPASESANVQAGAEVQHFVLTDGLSSVSVFISPLATVQPKVASSINSGALNVLTSQKNNHRITLVGEVPKATMQNIFSNLQYRGQ